ncbi:MAG: translocation/assembly module TamB domain-containing protein [Elusimicrobiota bacterium]|jgi:autotransporter translocation and assembly factor TamB
MRRLLNTVVLFFCILGASLWAMQSFVSSWEPRLLSALERRAGNVFHARVQIDSISVAFLHRLRLNNVQVWDTEKPSHLILRASDISLTLSLVDVPRALWRRRPLEAIGLISLNTPWVRGSPDILKNWPASGSEPKRWPIFFKLAWEHGTLQWMDPSAPHGTWTLYKSDGAFSVRGPSIRFTASGSLEQAEIVQVQLARLGRHWSAQAAITNGDASTTLALAQKLSAKPLDLSSCTVSGRYHLSVQLGGSTWPPQPASVADRLRKASLSFEGVQLRFRPSDLVLHLQGRLTADPHRLLANGLMITMGPNRIHLSGSLSPLGPTGRWNASAETRDFDLASLSAFSIQPDLLRGRGDAQLLIEGPLRDPQLTLHAKVPAGEFAHRSFQDGLIHWRYQSHRLELVKSQVHMLDGQIHLKGMASKTESDISVTGENLALSQVLPERFNGALDGRLHFAGAFHGPIDNGRTSGSFWINNFAWGSSAPTNLKGEMEITPRRFQAHASSEDSKTRLTLEGTTEENEMALDRLELHLPQGASLIAQARLDKDRRLQGTLDAENVNLASDINLLRRKLPGLKGQASAHAELSGTWEEPVLKGDLMAPSLTLNNVPLGKASASFLYKPGRLSFPSFKMEPGISGNLDYKIGSIPVWDLHVTAQGAPAATAGAYLMPRTSWTGSLSGQLTVHADEGLQGKGRVLWENGALGPWPLTRAETSFIFLPGSLTLQKMSCVSSSGTVNLEGHASWKVPKPGEAVSAVRFQAKGEALSPQDGTLWKVPLEATGDVHPADNWNGQADLRAPTVSVRQRTTDGARMHLAWDRQSLQWTNTEWGKQWTSNGSLLFGKQSPSVQARLQARRVPLTEWSQELKGWLSGICTWRGTLDHPTAEFSINLETASWRAIRFQSTVKGQWTAARLPLTIDATTDQGGQLHFQGGYDPAARDVQGTLSLAKLPLHPLGESFSLPRTLEGRADGTFTVRGPIDRPSFTGHLEGGPVVYGSNVANPFKLETFSFDLTAQPSPERYNGLRLTIMEGLAKTREERIRLNPGSFVDLVRDAREAKIQAGLEIRNLHLGVFTLFGGLDLQGLWQIRPEGIAVRGDLHTRSLFINDYELEEGLVSVDYYNNVLQFHPAARSPALMTGTVDFRQAPQLHFTDFFISGRDHQRLELTGDIGPSLWDFRMAGHGLDMGTLGGLAGFPYPVNGTADLSIRGTGDAAHPYAEGTIDLRQGSVLGLSFRNGASAFAWQDDRITFTRLILSDPDRYTLSGTGVFPLSTASGKKKGSDRTVNFSLRLQDSNLGLLQSISNQVKKANGDVQALVQITGTADQPHLRGSARIIDGDITGSHYFKRLHDLNMAADFEGDELVIHELRGQSGEGKILIAGKIAFAGLTPRAYDLHGDVVSRKGIQVQIPELAIPESPLAKRFRFLTISSYGDVKGHVIFKGPAETPAFSGEALITNGHFSFPPSHKNPPPPALMEWFRRIAWDVNLKFQDGAWFENELVEANLNGNLHLKGPSDRLRVDGGMDITEGQFSYLGVDFAIRSARYDVRSSDSDQGILNTPYVRGIAESQVQAVDTVSGQAGGGTGNRLDVNDTITLTIDYAPVDQIKPRFASATNPTLSQEKLLARVTQIDTGNLSPQERNYLFQQQMVRLIDTSLATPLAKRLLKPTGLVDTVRVSRIINPTTITPPETAGATAQQQTSTNLLANTKYTFEKNLSSRISLGYGVRFVEETVPDTLQNKLDLINDVELSYRWFKNVYVRGVFDLPNSSNPAFLPERRITIEPRLRFGWWGNTNKGKEKKTPTK